MMRKIYFMGLFFIFYASLLMSAVEGDEFRVVIKSTEEYVYSIHTENDGTLVAEKIDYRKNENAELKYFGANFLDVNQFFSKEIVNKIALNLKKSLYYCNDPKINKALLKGKQKVFGDVVSGNGNKNISVSEGKKYAILKSVLGPYFLINLTTLEFEKFCVERGRHVEWGYKGNFLAISFNGDKKRDRKFGSNSVLVYDILNMKYYFKDYGESRIEDIKWARRDCGLLVITSEKQKKFNPFNSILKRLGHPVTYRGFELRYVNNKLDSDISSVKLGQKIPNGYAFIAR